MNDKEENVDNKNTSDDIIVILDDNIDDDLEDDSLSLLELQRDLTPLYLGENIDDPSSAATLTAGHGASYMAADTLSTLSSVSSVTLLAGEDDISLTCDTTSLPEDPFPIGLPSMFSTADTAGSTTSTG